MKCIVILEPSVILWENHCINDINNDGMVSVDGTDMVVPSSSHSGRAGTATSSMGQGLDGKLGYASAAVKLFGSMAHSLVATGLT